jgi:hypothetical protein
MAIASCGYRPRAPERDVLRRVISEHFETFRARAARARVAHLVDRVLPAVPMRQWVLTMPPRVRYLLAWDHALTRAVASVYLRAVLGWLRRRARRQGVREGQGGAVAIVQRFGGALNLNVHVHTIVADGVFVRVWQRSSRSESAGRWLASANRPGTSGP